MSRIKVLPPELIAKIAAGEVIERPASVVKELVENSMDAGARRITIDIERGGKKLIRVSDDGCGMGREDSIRAFDRHATSKLSRLEELFAIRTLGFRGEALAAIAAVAHVRLVTRTPEDNEATEVRAENGRVLDAKAASRPAGTTVEVRELFHNVPARRKFMKGDNVETDHILNVLTSYGLARPDVGFQVTADGRETLSLRATDQLGERVAEVYGVQTFRELLPVKGMCRESPPSYDEYPLDRCSVSGYVSRPSLNKGRASQVYFFLNRRWFSERLLNQALLEAYGELLPTGRYPVAVINLEMNPSLVDVNVHPAKTEVRFADEGRVYAAVVDAVRNALATAESQPHGVPGRPLEPLPFKLKTPAPRVETGAVQKTITGLAAPPQPQAEPGQSKGLPEVTILGQAHNLYIIGQTREGIVIIDQHAANERVNYERLREQFFGSKVKSQTLLQPRTLELSAREKRILETHPKVFERLGYAVEDFGGKSCVLKAVPVVGGSALSAESLKDVISELMESLGKPGAVSDAVTDKALKLMACHVSVRAGEKLELAELRELVAQLYRAEDPYSCPHGRPTIIHMTRKQLEEKFGRS